MSNNRQKITFFAAREITVKKGKYFGFFLVSFISILKKKIIFSGILSFEWFLLSGCQAQNIDLSKNSRTTSANLTDKHWSMYRVFDWFCSFCFLLQDILLRAKPNSKFFQCTLWDISVLVNHVNWMNFVICQKCCYFY